MSGICKKIFAFMISIIFLVPLGLSIRAETVTGVDDLYEKSGYNEMYESLDDDTKNILSDSGVNDAKIDDSFSIDGLLSSISEMLADKVTAPLRVLVTIIAVTILSKLCACFENKNISEVSEIVGVVVAAFAALTPIISLISRTDAVMKSASAFLAISVPVYTVLMAVTGNTVTGAGYSVLALFAGNSIPVLSSALIIPLLNIFLALALVSAVSSMDLKNLTKSIYKFSNWLIVITTTLFSGLISFQAFLNSNTDSLSMKTAKLITSSAVPIVGGTISDSLSALQSSLSIVKSGIGAFGVLVMILIFLPVVIEAILWIIVFSAGGIVADLFQASKISEFMTITNSAAKMILAVLVSTCIALVICTSIVIFVKGGV